MSDRYKNQSTTGGYNFLPETEENGPLAKYKLGDIVNKQVRIVECLFDDHQGFAQYLAEEDDRRFAIVGNFPYALALNGYYTIRGSIVRDKRGQRKIKVMEYQSSFPTDKQGILTVLRSLHRLDLRAIQLYEEIGPDVIEVMIRDPQRIASALQGVGIKQATMWQEELINRGAKDAELKKLYDLGLSQQQATKLIVENGLKICEEANGNPYILIGKIKGFSFRKCDKIALESGKSVRNFTRINEGLLYVQSSIEQQGHCVYSLSDFLKNAHYLLDVSLNQIQAKNILKSAYGRALVTCKIGSHTYDIPVSDLDEDLRIWHESYHKKEERYRYIIDPIEESLMRKAIGNLKTESYLIVEERNGTDYIMSGNMYQAERGIAENIKQRKLSEKRPFKAVDQAIDKVLKSERVTLEDKQLEAVRTICAGEGGIYVLNGSAGCGKTFTLNIIMKVLRILYQTETKSTLTPCILAPTGKASKVASASTGLPAQTIHRALGLIVSGNSGQHDNLSVSSNLSNNCVVVDEFSMVDTLLCYQLLKGIPISSKVILLGDTAQLPSIRAGSVLKDFVKSGTIPVITLNVVKRQDASSGILLNANKIVCGERITSVIVNRSSMKGNAYIQQCPSKQDVQKKLIGFAKKFGLQAFQEGRVQVLCPLKADIAGVEELNYWIQQEVNPARPGQEIIVGRMNIKDRYGNEPYSKSFRTGDCVMHIKNNYKQPWFLKDKAGTYKESAMSGVINGEMGIIEDIKVFKDSSNTTHKVIYVRYEDHYISYDNDFDELALSYAMTIHKSQGSQWPVILCPIIQPTVLLTRKLLYTMYTRAQETCILLGRNDLISQAISNDREDKRQTFLCDRLREITP